MTSVRRPTRNCGTPSHTPASSPRSSATPTRRAGTPSPSESARIRSRSSVVLPQPGGERISVLSSSSPAQSLSRIGAAIPTASRAIRRASEETCRRFHTAPSFTTPLPQMPRRCPPRTVKKPLRTWESAVWAEAWVAISSSRASSAVRTGRSQPGRVISPSGSTRLTGCPARRRISSVRAFTASSSRSSARRCSGGSSAAA